MKKVFGILLIVIASCEEPVDWDQEIEFTPRLVVEAMVTNKPGYNYVKLSFPVQRQGESSRPVQGAQVLVTDGEEFEVFTEQADKPGYYIPDDDVRAVINKEYILYIKAGEYEFTASAFMTPVSGMENFSFIPIASNPGFYRINPWNGDDASFTRYIVEWDTVEGRQKVVFYEYSLETVDVNEFFKPAAEDLVFPQRARVIRQKYSLSPGYQQYLRSLLSETEWKGGWFDVLPGNLPTNLSEGGAGYFAASSLIVDTVYFNAR